MEEQVGWQEEGYNVSALKVVDMQEDSKVHYKEPQLARGSINKTC